MAQQQRAPEREISIVEPIVLRSLREHVHERLRQLIVGGRFPEGGRLIERDLAEMLGVSVTPVKDALRMLEGEGLLRVEARRGVFVQFGPRRAYEMAMARAAIEGMIAAIATRRLRSADRQRLAALLDAMRQASEAGILDEVVALNEQFHEAIGRVAQCDYLQSRLDSQRMYDHARRVAILGDEAERMTGYCEHRAIFEAMAAGDAAGAEQRMRAHILRSARNFLNHVFGTGLEEGDYVD